MEGGIVVLVVTFDDCSKSLGNGKYWRILVAAFLGIELVCLDFLIAFLLTTIVGCVIHPHLMIRAPKVSRAVPSTLPDV